MDRLELEKQETKRQAREQAVKAWGELRTLGIFAAHSIFLSELRIEVDKMCENLEAQIKKLTG